MRPSHLALLFTLVIAGCSQPESIQSRPLTNPLEELIRICKDEHNLDVTVTNFENTVWIYLPLEEGFLEMKATPQGPQKSSDASTSQLIKFLDGWHSDNSFHLKYDIESSKSYSKSFGYNSAFSKQYQAAQRQILSSITRAYAKFEKIPGENQLVERVPGDVDFLGMKKDTTHKNMVHSYVDTEKTPDFFVVVIADIVNGLASKTLFYIQDLKRAYVDQSFYEEYAKRVISEQPTGNINLIGDTTGQNVDYHNMTWPEFLSKQMVFRVNFKYQRSAFPPSDDTRMELLTIAADTVAAYDFKDFTSIQLHDLGNDATFSTAREDLAGYRSELPSKGRLIHIKFAPPSANDVE